MQANSQLAQVSPIVSVYVAMLLFARRAKPGMYRLPTPVIILFAHAHKATIRPIYGPIKPDIAWCLKKRFHS